MLYENGPCNDLFSCRSGTINVCSLSWYRWPVTKHVTGLRAVISSKKNELRNKVAVNLPQTVYFWEYREVLVCIRVFSWAKMWQFCVLTAPPRWTCGASLLHRIFKGLDRSTVSLLRNWLLMNDVVTCQYVNLSTCHQHPCVWWILYGEWWINDFFCTII